MKSPIGYYEHAVPSAIEAQRAHRKRRNLLLDLYYFTVFFSLAATVSLTLLSDYPAVATGIIGLGFFSVLILLQYRWPLIRPRFIQGRHVRADNIYQQTLAELGDHQYDITGEGWGQSGERHAEFPDLYRVISSTMKQLGGDITDGAIDIYGTTALHGKFIVLLGELIALPPNKPHAFDAESQRIIGQMHQLLGLPEGTLVFSTKELDGNNCHVFALFQEFAYDSWQHRPVYFGNSNWARLLKKSGKPQALLGQLPPEILCKLMASVNA